MLTHAACDDVSDISAADLAQRLVQLSSQRSALHVGAPLNASIRASLPRRAAALVWDTKASGGSMPRTALLRGDVVQATPTDAAGALLSLQLSRDVRFCFAQPQQRRLIGVLSSRSADAALTTSGVQTAYFYWMDECAPQLEGKRRRSTRALQKTILQWALRKFSRSRVTKNISLRALETAFPALLAYAPSEREELLKDATEMLGRGTVVWYGGTLIRQFPDSGSSSLCFPLLSTAEERCAAAMMFGLSHAQLIAADRRHDLAQAFRYLFETYGVAGLAQSPALTRCVLLVAAALAPLFPPASLTGRTLRALCQPYLPILCCVEDETPPAVIARVDEGTALSIGVLLRQIHELVRRAVATDHHRHRQLRNEQLASVQRPDADANDFFAELNVVKVNCASLTSALVASVGGSSSSTSTRAAAASDVGWRTRLLEWVLPWWQDDLAPIQTGSGAGETELKINAKAAAAALLEPLAADHALLAVMRRTRKRRHEGAL